MEAKGHFSREEINSTVWEVPEKYTRLKQIGTGAYGSVWAVINGSYSGCMLSVLLGLASVLD